MQTAFRLGVLTIACLLLALPALNAQDEDKGRALANRVATACGVGAWAKVASLRFTWRHLVSGTERGYDWDVEAGTVKVTVAGKTVEVPVRGWSEDANPSPEERAAHRVWVNDSFWALCGLRMAWDEVAGFDDLGKVEVPSLPKLGKRRALRVRYGPKGGYTPGDHYVLYLGDDDRPVAWAYHMRGAKAPRLVTTWETYRQIGGLNLPTRFGLPGGTLLIGIEGIGVAQRKPAPASRPTSRPTSRPR